MLRKMLRKMLSQPLRQKKHINIQFDFLYMSLLRSPFFFTTFVGGLSLVSLLYLQWKKQRLIKPLVSASTSSILSLDEVYVQKAKQRFLDFNNSNRLDIDPNSNIDTRFYDIEMYHDAVRLERNDLELTWKRRVLIEYTPRGNIIMFYDVYKHGFSYYADNSIPYSILNAVAMKYVQLFRCRDFFMDENSIPPIWSSPLIRLFKEKEKRDAEAKRKQMHLGSPLHIDVKKGPFAKFSGKPAMPSQDIVSNTTRHKPRTLYEWLTFIYRHWVYPVKPSTVVVDKPSRSNQTLDNGTEQMKNRTIYLGKCANFSMLSYSAPVLRRVSNKSLDVSYSSYKSWRNPSATIFA